MVSVVQLVEHQVVVLEVAGSSPVTHPNSSEGIFCSPWTFSCLAPCTLSATLPSHARKTWQNSTSIRKSIELTSIARGTAGRKLAGTTSSEHIFDTLGLYPGYIRPRRR